MPITLSTQIVINLYAEADNAIAQGNYNDASLLGDPIATEQKTTRFRIIRII